MSSSKKQAGQYPGGPIVPNTAFIDLDKAGQASKAARQESPDHKTTEIESRSHEKQWRHGEGTPQEEVRERFLFSLLEIITAFRL